LTSGRFTDLPAPVYKVTVQTLILAAGRFGPTLSAEIAAGREPRLDVFELQAALGADLLDYRDVDASTKPAVRLVRRALGPSAALAVLGASVASRYQAVLTTGEDIGIPLAALLVGRRRRPFHTMIAHTLTPAKKRIFFRMLRVDRRIDRILCYASSEETHLIERLAFPAERVRRIYYQADVRFFRPQDGLSAEADLICSAGQLLRDYDALIDAVRDLPVRVSIAAGSPWIGSELTPRGPLPPNVDWRRYSRNELRDLYARSTLAVVPILENDYQTGISTILEMMAMGKCVIATRTRGQTDTIIDGETGVYVPPGDRPALRAAIVRLLERPDEAKRIGNAARAFVEREASLELFVSRIAETVRAGIAC
jgi:glycosyltransferase involved in cell wall biosynthesis